ncbi:aldehyde dehydrogenase family protein [Nocardioides aquiterrae]|uniref:Aldehyde dehydrogenase family protein n=1 Tax=Nocardioides aquiterrae TaxID=203799 RepID=A0ABN1UAR9_9ACTN
MERHAKPMWIAGARATGSRTDSICSPYDGAHVGDVILADPDHVEQAVAAAHRAQRPLAQLPAYRRADALEHVALRLRERQEEMAAVIVAEGGKPVRWAMAEVDRAAITFRLAAEEARRWSGDLQRLDTDQAGEGRLALNRKVPRGPVLGITPFNFPLNLVAHKVAPALGVGAPIIIKPAPATPLTALVLGELLAETDLPEGSWSVMPVPNSEMDPLVADPRLPVISFTGSGPVGWSILDRVPRKHVTLELGGNAAVVVCADWNTEADLELAARRIAALGMGNAGQSCISVQRVIADRSVYDRLLDKITVHVRGEVLGDPRNATTTVGPMITEAAAERAQAWVREAATAGATIVTGGDRDRALLTPTVLTNVPGDAKVNRDEVFAPVLTVTAVDSEQEAFGVVNDSAFGLHAGVFTHDLATAFRAHRELQVGGVIVGDVPTYRAEQMPYGGIKQSGVGREGVRFAMDDLTYDRSLVLTAIEL